MQGNDDAGAVGAGIGVLRSISVLANPGADRPDLPTVTTPQTLTHDIRVTGPIPTVGDVTFAGRLGRRVTARRDGVALTFVRRALYLDPTDDSTDAPALHHGLADSRDSSGSGTDQPVARPEVSEPPTRAFEVRGGSAAGSTAREGPTEREWRAGGHRAQAGASPVADESAVERAQRQSGATPASRPAAGGDDRGRDAPGPSVEDAWTHRLERLAGGVRPRRIHGPRPSSTSADVHPGHGEPARSRDRAAGTRDDRAGRVPGQQPSTRAARESRESSIHRQWEPTFRRRAPAGVAREDIPDERPHPGRRPSTAVGPATPSTPGDDTTHARSGPNGPEPGESHDPTGSRTVESRVPLVVLERGIANRAFGRTSVTRPAGRDSLRRSVAATPGQEQRDAASAGTSPQPPAETSPRRPVAPPSMGPSPGAPGTHEQVRREARWTPRRRVHDAVTRVRERPPKSFPERVVARGLWAGEASEEKTYTGDRREGATASDRAQTEPDPAGGLTPTTAWRAGDSRARMAAGPDTPAADDRSAPDATEPPSPAPVDRRRRAVQTGPARIGSVARMPTLTHQAGSPHPEQSRTGATPGPGRPTAGIDQQTPSRLPPTTTEPDSAGGLPSTAARTADPGAGLRGVTSDPGTPEAGTSPARTESSLEAPPAGDRSERDSSEPASPAPADRRRRAVQTGPARIGSVARMPTLTHQAGSPHPEQSRTGATPGPGRPTASVGHHTGGRLTSTTTEPDSAGGLPSTAARTADPGAGLRGVTSGPGTPEAGTSPARTESGLEAPPAGDRSERDSSEPALPASVERRRRAVQTGPARIGSVARMPTLTHQAGSPHPEQSRTGATPGPGRPTASVDQQTPSRLPPTTTEPDSSGELPSTAVRTADPGAGLRGVTSDPGTPEAGTSPARTESSLEAPAAGDRSERDSSEPASPAPADRRRRGVQTGPARIGSVARMPTLTHQAGSLHPEQSRTGATRAPEQPAGSIGQHTGSGLPLTTTGAASDRDTPAAGARSGPDSRGRASPAPAERSRRGVQVESDRIGSVTEMPTLTHQTGSPQPEQPRTETTRPLEQPTGSASLQTGGEPLAERAAPTRTATERAARTRKQGRHATVPGPGERDRSFGDAGREAQFPDLDIRRPTPTVDATRRDEVTRTPADDRRPEREADRSRDTDHEMEGAIEEVFSRHGSDLTAYNSDVDRVVDRLYREVERKMRIERERRGL